MTVSLRLARVALTRNSPHYALVAIPSTYRLRARPLEVLGTYAPLPVLPPTVSLSPNGTVRGPEWGPPQALPVSGKKQATGEKSVQWNEARVKWWLSHGAVPSKRVQKLLVHAGVLGARSPVLREHG